MYSSTPLNAIQHTHSMVGGGRERCGDWNGRHDVADGTRCRKFDRRFRRPVSWPESMEARSGTGHHLCWSRDTAGRCRRIPDRCTGCSLYHHQPQAKHAMGHHFQPMTHFTLPIVIIIIIIIKERVVSIDHSVDMLHQHITGVSQRVQQLLESFQTCANHFTKKFRIR